MEETYVLEVDGKIVSYLSGEDTDGFLFIHTLACLKEYQNHGYGTMLLSEAKKDALKKKKKGLRLLSKEKNIQYYQRFGFKEVTYESPSWHMMELDMEETKK